MPTKSAEALPADAQLLYPSDDDEVSDDDESLDSDDGGQGRIYTPNAGGHVSDELDINSFSSYQILRRNFEARDGVRTDHDNVCVDVRRSVAPDQDSAVVARLEEREASGRTRNEATCQSCDDNHGVTSSNHYGVHANVNSSRADSVDYEHSDYETVEYEHGDYEHGDYEHSDYEHSDVEYEHGNYEHGDYNHGECSYVDYAYEHGDKVE